MNRIPSVCAQWPVFSLGLRPFYLLAALWALLTVPLWWLLFSGILRLHPVVPIVFWHAHEMIFGLAGAVIWGFLLTAVGNWTQQRTASGGRLAGLAVLWIAARIGMWTGPLPVAIVLELLVIPAVLLCVLPPIIKKRQYRNLFVAVVGVVLELLDILFFYDIPHPEQLQPLVLAAFGVIISLESIMIGRVLPLFSRNMAAVVPRFQSLIFERGVVVMTMVAAVGLLTNGSPLLRCGLCSAAVMVHAIRIWNWRPWKVRHHPLLWVLYLGAASIPAGWALAALATVQIVSVSAVLHTWAFGMVILMMGMMTRSSMGHTGRALRSDAMELSIYLSLFLAGIVRLSPFMVPWSIVHLNAVLLIVVSLWCFAYGLFLYRYAPWLMAPRADASLR